MRKRTIMISLICILTAAVIIIIFAAVSGRKPYKDLEAVQIVSAAVRLTPPDETIQITETEKLVDLLKDVVIYHEDNSYTEYSGQGVIFTLVMTDGTQTSIMAYNPFLVIDGVGYKTKYEPCEALNHYANMLLEQTDAMWDRIPMVRINSKLYYDTGKESTVIGRCGNMDGEITSTVDGSEIPMEDNQSNFGSGFGYQYGAEDTIEIYMNEKWFVFESREETE